MTPPLDTARRSSGHGDPLLLALALALPPFNPALCSRLSCPVRGCAGVELYDGQLDGCGDRAALSGCPWATDDARRAFAFAESIRERGYPHSGAIETFGARPVERFPRLNLERWGVGSAIVEFDSDSVRVHVREGRPDAEAPGRPVRETPTNRESAR